MTAKEKAKELISEYEVLSIYPKTCALIAVDEIISVNIKYHGRQIENNLSNIEYWKEVKQELEKL